MYVSFTVSQNISKIPVITTCWMCAIRYKIRVFIKLIRNPTCAKYFPSKNLRFFKIIFVFFTENLN